MNRLTQSEENYLKAIWKQVSQSGESVTTNEIASLVHTRAASVTDMLKKLADKKLILYKPYQGVRLSSKGMTIASQVVRKHRLWEVFLVKELGYKWDEVHDIAEQLEHVSSETLTDRLDQFLGFPKNDPHGDPIPDRNGKIRDTHATRLSVLTRGQSGIMTGVAEDDPEFLHFLDAHRMQLGCTIAIDNINAYDRSMEITVQKKKFVISQMIADNILVKKRHG